MNDLPAKQDPPDHVYFDPGDYAGFLRRIVAVVGDVLCLAVVLGAAYEAFGALGVGVTESGAPALWLVNCALAATYFYLTLMKRSRLRSPGYWATGLKIVDLRGEPPSMFLMSVRLLWWVLGPVNPLLDLIFMTNEEHRQTIRDKLIGTYVVDKDAEPAGWGHRVYSHWSFMGMMFLFPEVKPVDDG